jgi:GT2 family glycosyltransferase
MTSLAIGICTRDRPEELAETLDSIAHSRYRVDRVVVADDGTDWRTPEVCAAAPFAVDYTSGPRRGLAPNRNHLLTWIREDFILFLDDDCLLGATFLEEAMACMMQWERMEGPGRVVVTGAEMNTGRIVQAAAQTFLGFQARPYAAGERMTSIVINATVFPRSLFAAHRFDDQIRYGYEEVDLASRAACSGFRIVSCPKAVNDHRPSPRSRADYESALVASRLFVTFKRYALTEHRYARATAFAMLAPLHAVAAGGKARGLRGAWDAVLAVWRACTYLRAHRAGTSSPIKSPR